MSDEVLQRAIADAQGVDTEAVGRTSSPERLGEHRAVVVEAAYRISEPKTCRPS
ncbi:hypothetical protein [Streptomyces sp. NPDC002676]